MNVRRTALLPLPAAHLYDIIEAAENYPRFLPWCVGARIVSRDDSLVSADLQVKWGGMQFEMRTRNPKRRPEYMAIHLERGPFKRFEGEWLVTVLAPDACKVAFHLDYEFDSSFMTRVAGPVFKRLTDTMVEAFIQHALATPVVALTPAAAPWEAPSPLLSPAPAQVLAEAPAAAPAEAGLTAPEPPAPDLHPLMVRLVYLTGATVLSAESFDAWAQQEGPAMVVFAEDPERYKETLDLAVVVPELHATGGRRFRVGVLPPAASRAVAPRFGLARWPAFVMLRDGQYLGAVDGLRDRDVDSAELLRLLAGDQSPHIC